MICGFDEPFPGIVGRYLRPDMLKLERTMRVFLTGVQIILPYTTEIEILKLAQRYAESKFDNLKEKTKLSDILIQERRLVVCFHNGWTAVNSRGFNNYMQLNEGVSETDQMGISDPERGLKCLENNSVIEIDNVFLDEYALFAFQLEYVVAIANERLGKDMVKIIVGWMPLLISEELFQKQEFIIKEELLLGPCKNLINKI